MKQIKDTNQLLKDEKLYDHVIHYYDEDRSPGKKFNWNEMVEANKNIPQIPFERKSNML